MTKLLAALALIMIGRAIGWHQAHHTVAEECRRLGSFFVGDTVFRCVAIERKEEQASND